MCHIHIVFTYLLCLIKYIRQIFSVSMPRTYLSTLRELKTLENSLKSTLNIQKLKQQTIDHLRAKLTRLQSKYILLSDHTLNLTRENALLGKRITDLKATQVPLKTHNKRTQHSPLTSDQNTETILITTRNKRVQIAKNQVDQFTSTIEIPLFHPSTPRTSHSDED
jgi:predicted nuclease with TOPRIM domain